MLKLMQGDCLELMKDIPDKSVDLILTDPPYGTTACKWDSVIPFEPMWAQLKRVIKDTGAIVLTASQPFTSALVMSNPQWFRFSWVWNKKFAGNFALSRYQPQKIHEDIVVFSKKPTIFNPQKTKRDNPIKHGANKCASESSKIHRPKGEYDNKVYEYKEPESIILFSNRDEKRGYHPTQKPVALLEYLIRTYTNEGETVLDFTMGSGSTGVACINTNRNFIGIELDAGYFKIAEKRIADAQNKPEQISLIATK